MNLSVVIPTYNRPELLRRVLEALCRQTLPRDRFEVLVVDDGSPQPLDDLAAGFSPRLPVRFLRKPNSGLASTRNFGAAQARGDVLLFLDDDIVACPEFLAEHLRVHEAEDRVVALGALPHPDDLAVTPFLYYLNRIVHYDLFLRFGSADRIPLPPLNGNSSIRRCHFEAAGGYSLTFSSYGGEDTELGYRLLKSGLRFVYAERARGYHYHSKGFEAYKRDMYSSGVTMVDIVRKHPEVISRVNLDLAAGRLGDLPPGKRVKRLVFLVLVHAPILVKAMEWIVALGERLELKRPLYPLYLVAAHYYYGMGMRQEIERAGLRATGG